jgi:hypothetical protein
MVFIGKLLIASLIYFVITSTVSYFRKRNQEAEWHRKKHEAENTAKKENDGQKPVG